MPEMPEDNFVSENEPEKIPDEETPIDGADFNDSKNAVSLREPTEKHFLEHYKTQDKPEAMRAAERKEQRTDETGIVQDRSKRIEAYVERLEHVFLNPDSGVRERNIEMLKPIIHENTLIKEKDFPESHFTFHKQQLVDRGIPKEQVEQEFNEEKRQQEINRVRESQEMSLDAWIDYLTGEDCTYPADIKYFAIQGILRLGNFDTEKYSFTKRFPSTTAPFAEIDREALSVVLGAVEAKNYGKPTDTYSPDLLSLIDRGNSFGDMYALAMRELDQKAEKSDLLPIVDGEWRVFEKGSDPHELSDALTGKRSNLCIADIGSAAAYLNQGSVEVYFSYNRAKQPMVPRIAIAYNEAKGGVYEVRGTYNKNEDTDPYIEESGILMERLKDLPNGESFAKKDADMKKVTELYNKCFKIDKKTGEKTYLDPDLTKDDLIFLYEINAPIEGFGYQKDPRIAELRKQRNPEQDMPIVFGCTKEQIAHTPDDINEDTKAYVGKLEEGIFHKLPENLEHVHTSFPEGKIRTYHIKTKGETKNQYQAQLREKNISVMDYAKDLLESPDFAPSSENIDLVRVTVKDLGFPQGATTAEIYSRREALGLELCPPAVGPALRLSYTGGDWMLIGMKQIANRDGGPCLFSMGRVAGELRLFGSHPEPAHRWNADLKFVFRLRKKLESSES